MPASLYIRMYRSRIIEARRTRTGPSAHKSDTLETVRATVGCQLDFKLALSSPPYQLGLRPQLVPTCSTCRGIFFEKVSVIITPAAQIHTNTNHVAVVRGCRATLDCQATLAAFP